MVEDETATSVTVDVVAGTIELLGGGIHDAADGILTCTTDADNVETITWWKDEVEVSWLSWPNARYLIM